MRVTARNQPSEGGLARVCQSPRGYIIKLDGKDVGRVGSSRNLFAKTPAERGCLSWHWYAHVGGESRNSAANDCNYPTKEEARDACIEWIKATFREKARQSAVPQSGTGEKP